MSEPYTALQSDGIGIVVKGEPAEIRILLEHAREMDGLAGLMTDAGLFSVDADLEWRLSALEHDPPGDDRAP